MLGVCIFLNYFEMNENLNFKVSILRLYNIDLRLEIF